MTLLVIHRGHLVNDMGSSLRLKHHLVTSFTLQPQIGRPVSGIDIFWHSKTLFSCKSRKLYIIFKTLNKAFLLLIAMESSVSRYLALIWSIHVYSGLFRSIHAFIPTPPPQISTKLSCFFLGGGGPGYTEHEIEC